MILDGEDQTNRLHPTSSIEDSVDQENEHNSEVSRLQPGRPAIIPVPNITTVATFSCDLKDSGIEQRPISYEMPILDRTEVVAHSNPIGFDFSRQLDCSAGNNTDQLENDDPSSQHGRRANCRRMSSDHEVCELFEKHDAVSVICECGRPRFTELPGFQRWQKGRKVEGQLPMPFRIVGGNQVRSRGQLRDLNAGATASTVIQRPSLDFDKMQRYCLTRVHHPPRGVSKPKIVKVKSLRGSFSMSSIGCMRSEFLDPSVFSFRSISQNRGSTTLNLTDGN